MQAERNESGAKLVRCWFVVRIFPTYVEATLLAPANLVSTAASSCNVMNVNASNNQVSLMRKLLGAVWSYLFECRGGRSPCRCLR